MAIAKPVLGRTIKRKIHSIGGRKTPFIAGHKLLYTCNLRCEMCPFWRRPDERLLSLSEEIKMMDTLVEADVSFMGFEGGEPLLRNDLPEILKESHKRFHTSMVTNGWLLKSRIKSISNYLDYLFVSIDGLEDTHDRQRGIPGSFKRAVDGIKEAKRYLPVSMSTTITENNLDSIFDLMELARSIDVSVNLQVSYNYSTADKISPERERLHHILIKLKEMKKSGYPIVNSYEYFDAVINSWYNNIPWVCKPWSTINIDPLGNIVMPCYVLNEYSGKYKVWEVNIKELWNSYDWGQYESCNKCSLSCYLEPSLFSWKKPSMIQERIINGIGSYIASMF
ncbi:PTO1314 family radical SAM protein [Picrophilus oshimae]|uniref:Radical SAM protein, PTO1314 family n=1 Tax=Picrophilus torridus (strain ATCC 700027 / DSM 9790 / JCM 10055 / NBRC 100828 / KAW 2/3) TaxID=1122961 RepID=A0A8G2L7I5_PICTO|nr:PTO1314 family radical SAM protein [Picrophilus oshimae]SMD31030.1 radical SAM protein, PTO1314 family [Picrophilus oshimae DSM 9789]